MLPTAFLKNHCFYLNLTIIFSANLYLKPGNLLVKFSILWYKVFTLLFINFIFKADFRAKF